MEKSMVINFPKNLAPYLKTSKISIDFVQYIFKFENSYGASILWFDTGFGFGSYGFRDGLWELAVTKWSEDETWKIVYDVIGDGNVYQGLRNSEVFKILNSIRYL